MSNDQERAEATAGRESEGSGSHGEEIAERWAGASRLRAAGRATTNERTHAFVPRRPSTTTLTFSLYPPPPPTFVSCCLAASLRPSPSLSDPLRLS